MPCPNITGSFNNLLYQSFDGTVNINAKGAFDYVDTGGGRPVGTQYPLTLKTVDGIQFDAKKVISFMVEAIQYNHIQLDFYVLSEHNRRICTKLSRQRKWRMAYRQWFDTLRRF